MPSDLPQRKAFRFLTERLQSQEPFTRRDLANATGWAGSTLATYWSKQFKPFVIPIGGRQYRVADAFRSFADWKKFQRHVSQTRPRTADCRRLVYDSVVVYEFFMPLTNETVLRTTLDALFFKDHIIAKLRAIGSQEISRRVAIEGGETPEAYFERICDWIDSHFVGYSIYHVAGRIRASKLATREQVAEMENKGRRYLVDETTAVSRFIFPCTDDREADLVRYFFDALFVQSMIQLVNAEDEIWMVESGIRNRVHIWRVPSDDHGDAVLP
jgi:hypothetical protein